MNTLINYLVIIYLTITEVYMWKRDYSEYNIQIEVCIIYYICIYIYIYKYIYILATPLRHIWNL